MSLSRRKNVKPVRGRGLNPVLLTRIRNARQGTQSTTQETVITLVSYREGKRKIRTGGKPQQPGCHAARRSAPAETPHHRYRFSGNALSEARREPSEGPERLAHVRRGRGGLQRVLGGAGEGPAKTRTTGRRGSRRKVCAPTAQPGRSWAILGLAIRWVDAYCGFANPPHTPHQSLCNLAGRKGLLAVC